MEERGAEEGAPPEGYAYLGEGGAGASSPPSGSPSSVSEAAAAAPASEASSDSDSDLEGWEPLGEEELDVEETLQHQPDPSNGCNRAPELSDGATAAGTWLATFDDAGGPLDPPHAELSDPHAAPPELGLEGVPAAGEAHALARRPTAAPADFALGAGSVEAVMAGMRGLSLGYAPPWAAAVGEGEWRRQLRERLEGRRGRQEATGADAGS